MLRQGGLPALSGIDVSAQAALVHSWTPQLPLQDPAHCYLCQSSLTLFHCAEEMQSAGPPHLQKHCSMYLCCAVEAALYVAATPESSQLRQSKHIHTEG